MAKYSTNRGGGGDGGESCELCGKETTSLRQANVAGARLLVCGDCAPHDDAGGRARRNEASNRDRNETGPTSRKKRAAQRTAKLYDQRKGDSSRWEKEGTNYERDRLPYLVSDYGERVTAAREAAGLRSDELAADLDVDESDVLAVEQGRATRAGVGGSLIRGLEERLDVELADE